MVVRILLTCFRFLILIMALAQGVSNHLYGQESARAVLEFEHISKGLSQHTVTSMLQDQNGFMWLGTRNGLNRYDGVEFSEYLLKANDSSLVSLGHVNCIYQDSQGTLWVGTRDNGLSYYYQDAECFVPLNTGPGSNKINNASVFDIYEDRENNFWIGTNRNGLFLFQRETGDIHNYQYHSYDPYSLSGNNISGIFEDGKGDLWISTRANGLNQLDKDNNRFYRYSHLETDDHSLSNSDIRATLVSSDGNIWIGTHDGLNLMYRDAFNRVVFKRFYHNSNDDQSISFDVISSLEEDAFGNIWVGTENGGLSIYHIRQEIFSQFFPDPKNPSSIGSNSIWTIFRDNTGMMWLGPLNAGIDLYNPNTTKFKHFQVEPYLNNTLSHNYITCFIEDQQGNLWIGTDGGGLNYFDQRSGEYTHFRHDPQDSNTIGSDAVLSLQYDQKGRLWVGTWEGGLNLFHPGTKSFSRFTHDPEDTTSISSNNIFSMMIDAEDNFWIAASGGSLDLFNPDQGNFKHYGAFTNCSIFKLLQDNHGRIWIGTDGFGLSLLDYKNGVIQHIKNDPNSPKSVISMFQDSRNRLWLGTEGTGLVNYDQELNKFHAITMEHGLPNQVINAIQEDDQGFLWLSTNKGLSKFDPENQSIRNFNEVDGLQSDEFIRGSSLVTVTGKVLFGGINGYNSFFPASIKDNQHVPPVYLTEFRLSNRVVRAMDENSPLEAHISKTSHLELTHDQSIFSFDFVALNYTDGINNQYQYMLEGYDSEWQSVGNTRTAAYTRVPPGDYKFKVKGSNNDGRWNENAATLAITVLPPWWKTNAAYIVYLVLLILAQWGIRSTIIYRERLSGKLQMEQLELKKMQELDAMKSRFFANISHEFRTPLTLIKEPLKAMYLDQLKGKSKQKFRVMLRNTQKLLSLTNKLQDLSRLSAGSLNLRASENDLIKFLKIISESFRSQAERQVLKFKFVNNGGPQTLYFDEEKLEDILYNILSNAFKFTAEYGTVIMSVTTISKHGKNWALIKVEDNGIGIPQDQIKNIFDRFYQADNQTDSSSRGSGIGLALTKELVELHHGRISVNSEEGIGTEVVIQLLCGADHLIPEEIVQTSKIEVTEFGELKGLSGTAREKSNDTELPDLPLILVVEDNYDMRSYITEHLETNHRIVEAGNGEEALKLAIKLLPELIISDIKMPIMDGVTMCKKLKQDERTSHIPVVLLTGRVDEENEIAGREHGADYYFTKPFNSKLLQLTVNNIIQSRKIMRNRYGTNNKISVEPSKIELSSGDEEFLKKALACVEENISNPEFSVIEFGKGLGISRMQLYRKLKSVTGHSANEFIRTIRIKRAAQLLEQSNYTIAEITYEVGFNDLQYFRECFKKHFNVTPSKYLENRDNT